MIEPRSEAAVVLLLPASRIDKEKLACLDHHGWPEQAIHEVLPCAEIIRRVMAQAEAIIGKMGAMRG